MTGSMGEWTGLIGDGRVLDLEQPRTAARCRCILPTATPTSSTITTRTSTPPRRRDLAPAPPGLSSPWSTPALIENLYLEDLAAEDHRFTFVCVPLKLVGATGSPVRPLAILPQSPRSEA